MLEGYLMLGMTFFIDRRLRFRCAPESKICTRGEKIPWKGRPGMWIILLPDFLVGDKMLVVVVRWCVRFVYKYKRG